MKKQSFQIPASITDPAEIINYLTDEQFNALSQYIGQGAAEYYRSMMEELNRVEGQLRAAGEVIALQRTAMSNLMAKIPPVRLRSGIDFKSGLN
jgi:hypothetical protein